MVLLNDNYNNNTIFRLGDLNGHSIKCKKKPKNIYAIILVQHLKENTAWIMHTEGRYSSFNFMLYNRLFKLFAIELGENISKHAKCQRKTRDKIISNGPSSLAEHLHKGRGRMKQNTAKSSMDDIIPKPGKFSK